MTCSAVDPAALARARRQVFLALFIAIAVTLHVLEALLPSPVPWLRLGLANIMTLAALYLFDGRAAWAVSLARVGVGALLLGRLFSPGFWLAAAGAIVATSAMIIVYRVAGRRLSPIGISAIGAAGHALGQILAARLLVIQHAAIWQIFPLFLLFTVFSGILTGWLAAGLLEQLKQHPAFQSAGDADSGPCGDHCSERS
ncbi:MAG: Gx transporter family protein [Desulfuromonadales bacterium]|jgi:heptaprenyl diphosphate synthase|nr:Gx transporter family protein [Desulfuromonadales bacterium]